MHDHRYSSCIKCLLQVTPIIEPMVPINSTRPMVPINSIRPVVPINSIRPVVPINNIGPVVPINSIGLLARELNAFGRDQWEELSHQSSL